MPRTIACRVTWFVLVVLLICGRRPANAADDASPGPNQADEPVAAEFSLDAAVAFLDTASLEWQSQRGCVTCHTNMSYLCARGSVALQTPAHEQVRGFVEQVVGEVWPDKGPRSEGEVVATAAALAMNDAATTGKLHPRSREALDRMWTVQAEDGSWNWPKCDWPPLESDDHYGVTLAAIAVGVAPDGYAAGEGAQQGIQRIRDYLKNNPPPTVHHEGMLVWANSRLGGLLTEDQVQATVDKLLALQHDDGGWGLAALGDWKRADGKQQEPETSDGYGTGFVIYVLRQAGVPAQSPAIQRGLDWLKTHQRASGRWFTRSLNRDNKHYITHAGTALAVMALAACGEAR